MDRPTTSKMASSPERKSSKNKLNEQEDQEDQPLDLSVKKKKPNQPIFKLPYSPNSESSWGCLEFYENDKLVLSHELWNHRPITISAETLLKMRMNPMEEGNDNLRNYTDWEHVIGDGFILQRQPGEKSIVEMQRINDSSKSIKYKIFVADKNIPVNTNDIYRIFDGNVALKNVENIKDIRSLYDLAKSSYLIIAIYGDFMNIMGGLISYETLNKNMMKKYPYWFMLKLNPEYSLLDKQALTIIKNKS